jgi:hypothetical protein
MRWTRIAWVGLMMVLPLRTAPVAWGQVSLLTPAEEVCCFDIMDEVAKRYFPKHLKKANKCTSKMAGSTKSPPTLERCFDGMAANTGEPWWLIEKLRDKALKKAAKKCGRQLNFDPLTFDTQPPLPQTCTCNTELTLGDQMRCKLGVSGKEADKDVCGIVTPTLMNANRGNDTPPQISLKCVEWQSSP